MSNSDEYECIVIQIKDAVDEISKTKNKEYYTALKMQYDYLVQAAQSLKDHQLALHWNDRQDATQIASKLNLSEIPKLPEKNLVYCQACNEECAMNYKRVPCGHDYCEKCMAHMCRMVGNDPCKMLSL
jgi:hypothetical protein